MGWKRFFSSDGDLHTTIRTGSVVNDVSTGRQGFVVSEDADTAIVSDDRGGMHAIIKAGSVNYDTSTGRSWFEV